MISRKEYFNFKQNFLKEINDFENNIEKEFKQNTGSYYTDIYFINDILIDIFSLKTLDEFSSMKILEPCVGVGNYIFAILFYLYEHNTNKEIVEKIKNNIYVVDINKEALNFYKNHLLILLKKLFDIKLLNSENYFNEHIGYNLIFNQYDKPIKYRSLEDVFPNINFKFDLILTNPPYKLLKLKANDERKEQIQKINKEMFKNTDTKTINLFKFFVEEIINNYAKENAIISLLIPFSFLKDLSCKKLRTFMLNKCSIINIKCINEENNIIKANQSMCNILCKKAKEDNYKFFVFQDYTKSKNNICITKEQIFFLTPNNEILTCNNEQLDLVEKLKDFPKIKDFDFIKNLRGELDLSIHKDSFSNEKTNYKLIRGRTIQLVENDNIDINEYVKNDFVLKSKKANYIFNPRIICQQIANLNKKKRLQFYYCDKPLVLADSCNFITIEDNDYKIDLFFLLAVLNSNIINDYFNIFSSNNHINNYEISNLPIPIKSNKEKISSLYKNYLSTKNESVLKEIEDEIRKAFQC